MKKLFASFVIFAALSSAVTPVYASSGKNILRDVLGTVVNEAVKSSTKQRPSSTTKDTKKQQPAPATPSTASEPQTISQEADTRLLYISLRIESDLCEMGNNILAYNKPAFEARLTREERLTPDLDDYDHDVRPTPSPVMYSRVCVKGRTIVLGSAGKDKKFTADFIITGDVDFPPLDRKWTGYEDAPDIPRIYVGEDISVIENFIGMSAASISKAQQQEQGRINLDPTSFVFTDLLYKDGKVSELYHHNGYALNSGEAWDFVRRKAVELGLKLGLEL